MKRKAFSLHPFKRAGLALAIAGLAGCAASNPDSAIDELNQRLVAHGGQPVRYVRSPADEQARADIVRQRLSQPVDMAGAVELAMVNNRSVQSSLAELGVSQAELAQATRIENPAFSFARVTSGDAVEYERAFKIDILGVLFIPWRQEIASRQLERTKLQAAGDIARIALEARKAWINAVAAGQAARYLADVNEAAEASALLAKRMLEAGNFSRLAHAREQVYYADATAQLAHARQAAVEARERLIRLLGLSGQDAQRLTLPARLPDLPASPRDFADSVQQAASRRHDLQRAKFELDGLSRSLGLTRTTRFINALETSYLRNSDKEGHRARGYELELRIPLFDWGDAKVARAEAVYLSAVNKAAEIGIHAESELRGSYHGYRTHYDLAKHYRDQVVPLRKTIAEENLLRYNGMLIGVFELLADAREQVGSVNAYLEALRAFWEADANLAMAETAGSPPESGGTATAISSAPASAGH
ncbi:TolC family protein [Chitinimonas arctica]|uniref:TolC family protein n=1 Tax=Chitinimonas arctica TaxID=2594795 RepID=A0A516SLS0_9NEIS|nr:TolC family protein [Chitinimonas arctica]QDQ29089.1 TolC family protein [Chitinimonas arctica]